MSKTLSDLFNLPIIKCHHKDKHCKFAYFEPYETHFSDGRIMDKWITKCVMKREFKDCYDIYGGDGDEETE